MIAIRVDGNPKIGLGHIMRSLSIAVKIKSFNVPCFFICAEDNAGTEIIRQKGFEALVLHSQWDHLASEIKPLADLIQNKNVELILIDSYCVSEAYLSEIKKLVRLAYIDDLNAFIYPCDILINYAKYSEKYSYAENYPDTVLLQGPSYIPLRDGFQSVPRKIIRNKTEKILITTGGSDHFGFTEKFISFIIENNLFWDMSFDIICGKFCSRADLLSDISSARENIKIFSNVQNIAEHMKTADIAISAAGTSLYELSACGTPAVCFTLADNQLENAKAFAEDGTMLYAGDIRSSIGETIVRICDCLTLLANDKEARKQQSEKMQSLVDGKGAGRIAKALVKMI